MPVKQGSEVKKSGRVFGQGQKIAKMVRAGLYARISTQDQQTLPMQNRAMREYATRRGWTLTMQVKEAGSSASSSEKVGASCSPDPLELHRTFIGALSPWLFAQLFSRHLWPSSLSRGFDRLLYFSSPLTDRQPFGRPLCSCRRL